MSVASLKTVGAYALVLVGVAALVVLSALSMHPSRAGATARPLSAANSLTDSPVGVSACSALSSPAASAETLRQAQGEARALLDSGNTGEAIAHLRSLAAADAGLPGIHLDLSTALLKAHQTEAAKAAINTQLGASECLSRLPPDALNTYCKTRMSQSTAAGCRQELAAIERSAHFQSALVQMELANSLGSGFAPTGAARLNGNGSLGAQPSGRNPSPKLLAAVREPALAIKRKPAPAPPSGGNPLAAAAGTDAALGAYSK